jgi:D-tyrosyl-tRNA(Tyr) deacylase
MRITVQRVKQASVSVNNEIVGAIENGLLLLVGFTHQDRLETVSTMIHKLTHLRIFNDKDGVMNESLLDQHLAVLSISQFTLYADTQKGHRPSYSEAAKPDQAKQLYDAFNQQLSQLVRVETGVFGADMHIEAHLDGPVTISLEKN